MIEKKQLPREITSYDLYKTFAVVLMTIDHVGFYFFPHDLWWRVFGRLCVPIWFFLIGYARSRDTGQKMWAGMVALMLANIVVGIPVFPSNILASIIFVRLTIDRFMERVLPYKQRFWITCGILTILIIPSCAAFEYGTQSLLMAMCGYLVRRRGEENVSAKFVDRYFIFALFGFILIQWLDFGFSMAQSMTMSVGCVGVMSMLYFFQPETFPALTAVLPRPFAALLRFTGRRTLLYYVLHMLILKSVAAWLDPHRFVLFHFSLFSAKGV